MSLGAMSVEPHRRRIIGAGQRADGAPCRARTNAMDGRNRRLADVADHGLGRLNWADSAPTGTASGTTGVRAIAALPSRARNSPRRPEHAFVGGPAKPSRRAGSAPSGVAAGRAGLRVAAVILSRARNRLHHTQQASRAGLLIWRAVKPHSIPASVITSYVGLMWRAAEAERGAAGQSLAHRERWTSTYLSLAPKCVGAAWSSCQQRYRPALVRRPGSGRILAGCRRRVPFGHIALLSGQRQCPE